jgi:alpha-1,6-mannosyltransferase
MTYSQTRQAVYFRTNYSLIFTNARTVHVHISNLAAQTGASLFLQTHAPPYASHLHFTHKVDESVMWIYNKTERLTERDLRSGTFTHLITEAQIKARDWTVAEVVRGFEGWYLERDIKAIIAQKGWLGLRDIIQARAGDKLWIEKRVE